MSHRDQVNDADLAIIGMSCRFPDANDVAQFWQNLASGRSSITRFRDDQLVAHSAAHRDQPGFVAAGAVLSDIDQFDAAFFGYSDREAESMDPQHRLFLECAWEAFEDAGYPPRGVRGLVGVYAGCGINTYLVNHVHPNRGFTPERTFLDSMSDLQLMIGNEKDFLNTRVSYKLDLRGPSVNVQAACATSLVALHLACQGLLTGECDLALAGCSTIRVPQHTGYVYQEDLVFSPDGHTRSFDARAQGTTFGSGVGVVLVKLLRHALADGDAIHAVIKGSAINNDGARKVGFTAVSLSGQAAVVADAIRAADVAAETITYVEAHGTATAMGDPVEVAALTRAFATERRGYCALGTVKTNLGHLSWSAGMAGLLKTVLALEHRQIPASLHFEQANPQIDFAHSPFYVNTALAPWRAEATPLRAGVSAFGLGGSNAHVILEEAPARAPGAADPAVVLLPLSGRSEAAVRALAARYRDHLDARPDAALGDLCFTAAVGRESFSHRAALVATSRAQLRGQLAALAGGPLPPSVRVAPAIGAHEPGARPIAFLCTGQGAQYEGMGRQLYDRAPVFRATIDACDAIARAAWPVSLLDVLYPAPGAASYLHEVRYTQAAMFAVECALARMWMAWGIQPAFVMGHSTGEYAAACIAGVFSLEDGMRLSIERGRLFEELVDPDGQMATVLAAEAQVAQAIAPYAREVAIAAVNGPLSTVIAGTRAALDAACAALEAAGVEVRRLRVARAGHAPMTEPVLAPLERLARTLTLSSPRIALVSNVTGERARDEVATPAYWARHTRETVRFADGMRCLARAGAQVFLEIGPDAVLVGMGAFCLHGNDVAWLPSLRRPTAVAHDDWRAVLTSLGKLYLEGATIDWPAVYRGAGHRRVHLPTYPFQRKRYWIDATGAARPVTPPARSFRDWLLEIDWQRAPAAPATLAGGTWIIVPDAGGLGRAVSDALTAAGARCHLATGRAALTALFASLDEIDGILHLAGLDAPRAETLADGSAATDAVWARCESLLALAQVAVAQPRIAPRLWVITRGAQAVGPDDRVDGLVQAPLWAMTRVIGMEHPELRCTRIDLAADSHASDVSAVVGELARDGAHDAVAFRAGERWAATLRRHRATEAAAPQLRGDGAYLVTGGLGGVGLLIAGWLVGQGARHLVLAGRGAPSAEARAAIEALERAGATVVIERADLAQRADVERLVARAQAGGHALRGIVHSAGVLDDGVMQQQTRERFCKVLQPKVAGAWNLHVVAAAAAPQLELFVLLSSAASLLGNPGQSNHAAANAFLDALAHHRHARGLPASAINWGAWTQAGALLRNDAARGRLDRLGFESIPSDEGLAALGYVLGRGVAQLGVAPMTWSKFLRECNVSGAAFFAALAGEAPADAPPSLRARLAASAPGEHRALIHAHVRAEAAHLLGLDPSDTAAIDDTRPLAAYGIDSLSSIELRNRLQSSLGSALPATFVFEHRTVAAMVDHLVTLPRADVPAPVAPPVIDEARGLSMQQQRWLSLIRGGYGQRVVPIVFDAELDPAAFRVALTAVVERHELLRYAFPDDRVELWPTERVVPANDALFVDVRALDAAERARVLGACVRQCWAEMPDPARRPSWAIRCLAYPGQFLLLLSLQHLDFDGTSLTTFVEDLRVTYRAAARGEPASLPSVVPYAAYVRWQRDYLADAIRDDRAFFQGLYASLDRTTALPGHAGFARTVAHESARWSDPVTPGLWDRVQRRAGALGVTSFSLLLAAYAALVAELAGTGEVVIAMITNGRPDQRFQDTIGPFTAPFPVKLSVAGQPVAALAHQASRIVAAITARSVYPVADLVQHVPAFKQLPIDSYFTDVGINFTNYRREVQQDAPRARVLEVLGPIQEPEFAAANTEELRRIPGLHLVMDLFGGELRCNFWYHRHRFAEREVAGWSARFFAHLATALADA